MTRVIRRSSARDLPPSADNYTSDAPAVVETRRMPRPDAMLRVTVPCGLTLRVKVVSAEPTETGWMGWAQQLDDASAEYRAFGVPAPYTDNFRIYDWQVVDR